jgi:hypothetical protein
VVGHQGRVVSASDRFWPKVAIHSPADCWIWVGARTPLGYGQFRDKGRTVYAHRWAFENANGPIPTGLTLDHLCRNPACVNPAHLEAVTHRINMRRGVGFSGVNARKTHCPRGHEYTPENTKWFKGGRTCRTCYLVHMKAMYAKRRARELSS